MSGPAVARCSPGQRVALRVFAAAAAATFVVDEFFRLVGLGPPNRDADANLAGSLARRVVRELLLLPVLVGMMLLPPRFVDPLRRRACSDYDTAPVAVAHRAVRAALVPFGGPGLSAADAGAGTTTAAADDASATDDNNNSSGDTGSAAATRPRRRTAAAVAATVAAVPEMRELLALLNVADLPHSDKRARAVVALVNAHTTAATEALRGLRCTWAIQSDLALLRLVSRATLWKEGVQVKEHVWPQLVSSGSAAAAPFRVKKPVRAMVLRSTRTAPRRVDEAEPRKRWRCLLYIHGGGMVSMRPWCYAKLAARYAGHLHGGTPVVAIDYSLAPEGPFPDAVNECFALYRALYHDADVQRDVFGAALPADGVDLDVVIMGDSAGGNLTAVTTLQILDARSGAASAGPLPAAAAAAGAAAGAAATAEKATGGGGQLRQLPAPVAVALTYPMTQPDAPSRKEFADDVLLPPVLHSIVGPLYLVGAQHSRAIRDDLRQRPWRLYPTLAPPHLLERFPPTRSWTGSFDPLRDDSHVLCDRITAAKLAASPDERAAGEADVVELPRITHGAFNTFDLIPEIREAIWRQADFINDAFDRAAKEK